MKKVITFMLACAMAAAIAFSVVSCSSYAHQSSESLRSIPHVKP